ncbi:MAG TPA: hypothetical protein VGU70_20885 [Methylobacterium sp.]|nr:hypothetical protein [Methylorubrum sp. B1-46]HEV2545211.1 hypothetical protein [Methylobacterium sp.]
MPGLFSATVFGACALFVTLLGTNLWALRVAAAMTAADEEGQANR